LISGLHAFAARYQIPPSARCPAPGGEIGRSTCDVIFFGKKLGMSRRAD